MLAAAHGIPEARAVATIAAPFDPAHVIGLFGEGAREIANKEDVEVTIAGRPFKVRRSFLEDAKQQNLAERVGALHKALLIFHSPTDDTVGIDNASHIFPTAKHPKSFISLAGADHLISRPKDAAYVARVISAWADRYLDMSVDAELTQDTRPASLPSKKHAAGSFSRRSSSAIIAYWPTSR